jgi:NTP pyrophosphatase (non-canonical NTP hydrolase)
MYRQVSARKRSAAVAFFTVPYIVLGFELRQLGCYAGDMTDLTDLQKRVLAFRDARDWRQFHNPKDSAMALSLEAAEVLEHFLWKNEAEMAEHLKTHKQAIGEELVDTLYWVLLMAHDFDIDLAELFDHKMAQNEAKYAVDKAKGNHKKYTELN